jgi:hypothetical protein
VNKICDQHLLGEVLSLKDDVVNVLGPRLTLERCRIELSVTRSSLVIPGATVIDCDIVAKRKACRFYWQHLRLLGCRLSGHFRQCFFGADDGDPENSHGEVQACDFTHARLDDCRFFRCAVETNSFPSWSCFTILRASAHRTALRGLAGPPELREFWELVAEAPEMIAADSFYAPGLAKSLGCDTEAIRVSIAGQEFIRQ